MALRGLLRLTFVQWTYGDIGDGWLAELGLQGLPLEKLCLCRCHNFTGVGLCAIRTLQCLMIESCGAFSADGGLVAVATLPLLRYLELVDVEVRCVMHNCLPGQTKGHAERPKLVLRV